MINILLGLQPFISGIISLGNPLYQIHCYMYMHLSVEDIVILSSGSETKIALAEILWEPEAQTGIKHLGETANINFKHFNNNNHAYGKHSISLGDD